jgi:folate-binding protein YgfZ
MSGGTYTILHERGIVGVGGPDAPKFLQDLVTADIQRVAADTAAYGALLTPQGKILFDFIVYRTGERFLLDTPRAAAADLAKRLLFYRLRARVEIEDLSATHCVIAAWGSGEKPTGPFAFVRDPRLAALGFRVIAPARPAPDLPGWRAVDASAYHAHRIALGVPEGGVDFAFGQAFPHDADMDQLGGIDTRKGCYVGQEVVSRMEHRGTARRRIVVARAATPLPAAGTPITADGRALGELASVSGTSGLARVRVDRVKEALDAGTPLRADGVIVSLAIPDWARFEWSAGASED